jgi:hypothetical protein
MNMSDRNERLTGRIILVVRWRLTIAVFVLLAILTAYVFYAFEPFEDNEKSTPAGIADFNDRKSFQIDPQAILESLNHGKTDVFSPVDASAELSLVKGRVSWLQSDFAKVASTLHEFIRMEPLTGWELHSMIFSATCQDDPIGFSEAHFYYFKTVFHSNGKIRYATEELIISPQYGRVEWAGESEFPRPLFGWKSLKLHEVKISAQRALKIAELYGGKKTRLLVQNRCRIHIGLSGNSNWEVLMYRDETGGLLFRMEIAPQTGRIQ